MMVTVESRLRSIVADRLGVDAAALGPRTLLADDLGVDSLDLAELGCALEEELDVHLSESAITSLRTYADLVGAAAHAVRQGRTATDVGPETGIFVRAQVVGGTRRRGHRVVRTGRLDPYLAEVIGDEALRSGAGTVLDLRVPEADEEDLSTVRAAFSWLGPRGVRVSVGRDDDHLEKLGS
jgi:acyl carrier protein